MAARCGPARSCGAQPLSVCSSTWSCWFSSVFSGARRRSCAPRAAPWWSRPPKARRSRAGSFASVPWRCNIAIWRGRAMLAGRFCRHVCDLDLVEVGHGFLDVLDADLAVLDGQQVLQRITRQLDVDLLVVKRLQASTLRSAPSSSRTLARTFVGDEEGDVLRAARRPSASAFLIRMATRISSSGGSMATVRPASKRGSGARRCPPALRIRVRGHDDVPSWPAGPRRR